MTKATEEDIAPNNTAERDEEELRKKRASWAGLNSALDHIFSGAEGDLFDGVLKDYTPVPQPFKSGEPKVDKAPGLSMGTIFRAVGFAFRHPIHTFNLIKAARAGTFTDPDFRRDLVENPKLWSFVQKVSAKLPQIGKVLGWFGVEVFKEGKILDTQALTTLKDAFTDTQVLQSVKSIAVSTMSPNPDWTKVISGGLGLLAENQTFKQYFREKGADIRDYVKELAASTTAVGQSLATYKVDTKILDQIPAILNNFPRLRDVWDGMQTQGAMLGAEVALDMIAQDQSLREFFNQNPRFISDIARGVIESNVSLSELAKGYKVDYRILDIVGHLTTDPALAKEVMGAYNKGDYLELTDKLIKALNRDDLGLREVLQTQLREGLFDEVIKGVLEQNDKAAEETPKIEGEPQSLRVKLQAFGVEAQDIPKITEIFPILLDSPADLQKIFAQFRGGDYKGMLSSLSDISHNNPGVNKYLKDNAALFQKIALKNVGVPDAMQEALATPAAEDQEGLQQHKGNITEIFQILLKSENKEKISQLFDLYQKAEWMPLLKEACRFMEEDPEFAEYLRFNKENFALIVDSVVNQSPAIKTWTAGANLGGLAGEILKDPGSIRLLMEGLEGGKVATAKAAVQVLAAKAMDGDFRNAFAGALYNVASGWLVGGGSQKQELVIGLLQAVSQRDNPEEQLKLSKLLQKGFKGMPPDDKGKEEAVKLLASKTLFDEVVIRGNEAPLKLERLKIDATFVNSTISNVSFKNTVFQNSSFIGATILYDVQFEGSTIERAILDSMVDALRKGKGNLNGVKLVGDISSIDLSGISLKGADLSGVTSMKGVNLEGADLADVKCDPMLLTETFNLDKSNAAITPEILRLQKAQVAERLISIVAEAGGLSTEAREEMSRRLSALLGSDSPIGDHARKMLESNLKDITDKVIHINPETLKHAVDYSPSTKRLLAALYDNRESSQAIDSVLMAQIMADKVSRKLFGEGANRGQDFALIDEMMQKVVQAFAANNSGFDPVALLENPGTEEFLEKIAINLKAKSHNTNMGKMTRLLTAGMAEGGIFLSKEDLTEELVISFASKMEVALGKNQLSDKETEALRSISNEIGANLFEGYETSSSAEYTGFICDILSDVLVKIKEEKGGADLSEILRAQGKTIVGEVNKGWISTTGTALTGLFLGAAKRGKGGVGGRYLEREAANNLFDPIKKVMDLEVGERVKVADVTERSPAIDRELGERAKGLARDIGIVRDVSPVATESNQPLGAAAKKLAQGVEVVKGEGVSHVGLRKGADGFQKSSS